MRFEMPGLIDLASTNDVISNLTWLLIISMYLTFSIQSSNHNILISRENNFR